jgi:hypothetical protein
MEFTAEDRIAINRKIAAVNARVDRIYEHLGIEPEPGETTSTDFPPDALAAARAGDMLEAIKLYRQQTGADLATAKAAVEEAAFGSS